MLFLRICTYLPALVLPLFPPQTVFSFFLAVLTASKAGLGKPNGTHFADCIALLERLIESRCFAIPAESMYSGDITNDYFAKFFELVK